MRPVLVTGCSSGIGLGTARLLAARGAVVYATVRRPQDAAALAGLERVEALLCDVTDDLQVAPCAPRSAPAARALRPRQRRRHRPRGAPLTDTTFDELRRVFEVNVFGVHRVTRAVSDLIVASRGRVVNVSSISGVLSSALLALRGPLPAGPGGTMCLVI